MTTERTLVPGVHVVPTSIGAFHALTSKADGPAERLLRNLLRAPKAPTTDDADLPELAAVADAETAITVLALAQDAGWVEGVETPTELGEGPLGHHLPDLLAPLSDEGCAALVDDQGFLLASVGMAPAVEEELSVLAAEVVRLRQRRHTLEASAHPAPGWSLVDVHGVPSVALYPLSIGTHTFVLVLGGLPRLNRPAFALLASALCRRYDAPAADPSDEPSGPHHQPGGTTHA